MIKYLCDITGCGKEALPPEGESWTSQEMIEMAMPKASYFWARFGFANITLCPEHRKEAVQILVEKLKQIYD